jgi:hypothetical protein
MTFTIYPNPSAAPFPSPALPIGATTPTPILLNDHIGPDDVVPGFNSTFIRIVMLGSASANPPLVLLQAVKPAGMLAETVGPEVEILPTHIFPNKLISLLDGTNDPIAAADAAWVSPFANNVYLLKIFVSIPGTRFRIRFRNTTAEARQFTWVVASSSAESLQPWIDVTTTPLTYNALINQPLTQILTIRNYGTTPFQVTGINPPLGAAFSLPVLPVTVNPASHQDLVITFTSPTTSGTTSTTSTVAVTPSDPNATSIAGHNQQFVINTTTQALEVTLLLDTSGSMGWAPNGTFLPAGSTAARISHLKTAVKLFLELLAIFGQNRGKYGIAKFPGKNPADLTTFDVISPSSIPNTFPSGPGTVKQTIDDLPAADGTPMGDGLSRVLADAPGFFSPDTSNRRWLLLMSDGANNSGAVAPLSFVVPPAGTATPKTSLEGRKIKLFAVGYGIPGSADVDYDLLTKLASGSFENGDIRQVTPTAAPGTAISEIAISQAFTSAIKSGLTSASSPSDPIGVLRSSADEARYSVIITPYDTKVAFVLNWGTADSDRLLMQLLTPIGELITPGSFDTRFPEPGLSFSQDSRYYIYAVDQEYLQNRRDPRQPRYGTWRIIISSPAIENSEDFENSETFAYDVLVESSLQLEVQLDRTTYYAGDPIDVSAIATLKGKPLKNISVTATITLPEQSANNWLAAVSITGEEYRRAAEALANQPDVNALLIKAFAARLKNIVFDDATNTLTVPLVDSKNQGVYQTTFSQTATPEKYTFYIIALGQTDEGVVFRREKAVEVRVGVRPDPAFTLIDVQYQPQLSDRRLLTALVKVTPRDRFGNVLLLDPATNSSIVLTAQGGNLTPLTTKLDASYTSTLTHSVGTTPMINLQIAGQDIITNRPVPAVGQSRYVDEVIEFKLGGEAATRANQHREPRQVLGDITTKPAEQFVSLGAYGSLTVGIQGQIITAQSDNDITVFVQPDSDLRPYRVEVLPVGLNSQWKGLGKSVGITQFFGLGQIGIKAAKAIRIVDESGRTRGANLQPLSTPGVSIRGVGVKQTALSSPKK